MLIFYVKSKKIMIPVKGEFQKKDLDIDFALPRFYQRAILIAPTKLFVLQNYASFLLHIRKNYVEADKILQRAIQSPDFSFPRHSSLLSSYIHFLRNKLHNSAKANEYQEMWLRLSTPVSQLPTPNTSATNTKEIVQQDNNNPYTEEATVQTHEEIDPVSTKDMDYYAGIY